MLVVTKFQSVISLIFFKIKVFGNHFLGGLIIFGADHPLEVAGGLLTGDFPVEGVKGPLVFSARKIKLFGIWFGSI